MLSDNQISHNAVLRPIWEIGEQLGLGREDIEPRGSTKAKIKTTALERSRGNRDGKLIVVSAITPTPTGEGKTTIAIGLGQALGRLGLRNTVVLRQPSLGPVFGLKGGACGGGYAQVVPMEEINMHFTGDLHAIAAAHNLLSSVMENHIYRGNRLVISIHDIQLKRVLDIESRDLRHVVIGLGGRLGGTPRESGFEITAASEIAAIHALASDLGDLKHRLGEITVAYTKEGAPVKARDLKIEGALAALLRDASMPNLVQTIENTPALVHGGPFANIAHGCPSLIAIKMALKFTDYVIVEPGFGVDLGLEKFCDIAARLGDLSPDIVIVVTTIKGLKYHGGAKLRDLGRIDAEALEKGLPILDRAIQNTRMFGLPAVVCVNHFATDGADEIETVMKWCECRSIPCALADVFRDGGKGGTELAQIVLDRLASESAAFRFLYPPDIPVEDKIRTIATSMYRVKDIEMTPSASRALARIGRLGLGDLPVCVAKTPLSLTDDDDIKGLPPEDYVLPITDLKPCTGAGFIVAYCGDISTMPALPSHPAAEDVGIDEIGRIIGLK